ncbi:hypothetical protein LTR94_029655, partial [Friedmanniomyces endolithicus]
HGDLGRGAGDGDLAQAAGRTGMNGTGMNDTGAQRGWRQTMAWAHGWLGLIAWSAGERDEAIAALARAVELDPANMGYRRLLRDYRASAGGVRARASALLDRTWAWLGGQRG